MPRLWLTDDGDLVEDGHPDARVLAYGEADEVPADANIRTKQAKAPRDKQAAKPANK